MKNRESQRFAFYILLLSILVSILLGAITAVIAAVLGAGQWSIVVGIVVCVVLLGIIPSWYNPQQEAFALLPAIRAACEDPTQQAQVKSALEKLERHGLRLSAPIQAIWEGERDQAVLTAGLTDTERIIVERALLLPGR